MKIVEFIGPISPPFNGPGVKNKIIRDELENKSVLYELYSFNTLKKNFLFQYFFHVFKNISVERTVILSVSKKGRFILSPIILFLTYFSLKRCLILIPAGGQFHVELRQIPNFLRHFYIKIIKSYTKIIVETNSLKIGLQNLGVFSIQIPNPRKININCSKKKIIDEIKVYFISSIKKEKGILDAIDAVEILNAKGLNVKLVIHGRIMNGFESEFSNKLNKSPNSIFKGGLSNEVVISTLNKKADFLLLPTYYPGEGLPGVLVESTIAEVPFLVTRIHGIEDYFTEDQSMTLINKQDPGNIAEKLQELIFNTEKYNKITSNQKLIKQQFSVSNYVNKIL